MVEFLVQVHTPRHVCLSDGLEHALLAAHK